MDSMPRLDVALCSPARAGRLWKIKQMTLFGYGGLCFMKPCILLEYSVTEAQGTTVMPGLASWNGTS